MIDTTEQTTCLACGNPLVQVEGRGHRKKLYCNDTCRQKAHRRQAQSNVTPVVTNDDLQQRIDELERDLAEAHRLIDEYINKKRMPTGWKKSLQERFWKHGEAADWPTLTISIPVPAGERAYRVFGLAASNELLEWASVALRNRNQS